MPNQTNGKPLSWDETKKNIDRFKRVAIKQLIDIYNNSKDRSDPTFKWGDEIENLVIKFDHNNRKARLSLTAKQFLDITDKRLKEDPDNQKAIWSPEVCEFMLENCPPKPYIMSEAEPWAHIKEVETNMRARREEAKQLLAEDEGLFTVTSFPMFGCDDHTFPYSEPDRSDSDTKSLFVNEDVVYTSYSLIRNAVKNVFQRRQRKSDANLPIYRDTKTMDPFIESLGNRLADRWAKPDHIYLDAQAFGWGSCAVQVTMQGSDMRQAFHIHDQLAPITPIALALTACTPIQRGYLTDCDCRWALLTQIGDDRDGQELGEMPIRDGDGMRINKSRYDTIEMYLSEDNQRYNDNPFPYNKDYYEVLLTAGLEPALAKHFAYFFIRDPLCIFNNMLDQSNDSLSEHLDNLMKTIWPSMRFKVPPPQEPDIGWRVEFRTMEVQLTDFENTAYVVFIVLLIKTVLHFKLNLLIPMSKVDENVIEASKRDSVNRCKFWFRKNIMTSDNNESEDESCIPMTINEIINGNDTEFPGLLTLIRQYLRTQTIDSETQHLIDSYLDLISGRADGRLRTGAKWIRDYVRNHKEYRNDSKINDSINYDLLVAINGLQNYKSAEEVLNNYKNC